jgi:crossover junction endodeoxyribonuclease RuvC
MNALIVGLDPGLAALGWGVIEVDGARRTARGHGVLRTLRRPGLSIGCDLTIRVGELARAVCTLLDEHRPYAASIEEFRFYGKGVTSSLQVANVVGMLRESLRTRGIPAAEYSAQEIKRAVTGDGNADKVTVQRMVQRWLAMSSLPRPEHAADALAAAITHAARLRLLRGGNGHAVR